MPGLAAQSLDAGSLMTAERPADVASGALKVEVFSEFAAARPVWESLAASGHSTPYQRFDWAESYFRHIEAPKGHTPALILLRHGNGEPALLLPLVLSKTGPVRVARFIGGKHSNFNLPLCQTGFSITAPALRAALKLAGQKAGVDLYAFMNQPLEWEGVANPLAALGGQASPSAGYKLALAADGEELLKNRLSKDARKKLRQKEGKLAALGTLAYRKPETTDEALAILQAFLDLKAQRFGTQGIDDPFAGADVRAFLEECVSVRFGEGKPAVELHALMLNDKPVSIYGALSDNQRFCGLFTAFDGDPEISRSSPGDILLMAMIRECCARGLATFDLGVGEARYKAQVCDAREEMIDAFLPASPLGWLAAKAMAVAQNAKRRIKQSAVGTNLIARLRKLRAKA